MDLDSNKFVRFHVMCHETLGVKMVFFPSHSLSMCINFSILKLPNAEYFHSIAFAYPFLVKTKVVYFNGFVYSRVFLCECMHICAFVLNCMESRMSALNETAATYTHESVVRTDACVCVCVLYTAVLSMSYVSLPVHKFAMKFRIFVLSLSFGVMLSLSKLSPCASLDVWLLRCSQFFTVIVVVVAVIPSSSLIERIFFPLFLSFSPYR